MLDTSLIIVKGESVELMIVEKRRNPLHLDPGCNAGELIIEGEQTPSDALVTQGPQEGENELLHTHNPHCFIELFDKPTTPLITLFR